MTPTIGSTSGVVGRPRHNGPDRSRRQPRRTTVLGPERQRECGCPCPFSVLPVRLDSLSVTTEVFRRRRVRLMTRSAMNSRMKEGNPTYKEILR